jgi:hypothetical protein
MDSTSSEILQFVALALVAGFVLLVASLMTPWLHGNPKPLPTRRLQIRDLGTNLTAISAADLAAVQQAASGADIGPLQDLARDVEAKKLGATESEQETETLEPEPPLADPEAEMRRKVMRERLQAMARNNPGAMAGVVQTWIQQK